MPHFREFVDPDFLCNIDFLTDKGQYMRKIVTIKHVDKQEIHNGKGSKDRVATVHTHETKPFVLSNHNMKTLVRLLRKVNTDDWKGEKIELNIVENIKAFGNMHDVIRVAAQKPAPSKPIDYSTQTASLRACTTLAELQAVYTALTADEKAGTLKVKDEMKQKLA